MSTPNSNLAYVSVNVLVEALGTAKSRYVASPVSGTVRKVLFAVDTAVDGDNICTPKIAGTAITGGAKTLTTAHTAGKVQVTTPTAANSVKRGDALEVATDGGGGAGQVNVTFLIEQD
jgi:hypothetical protein